MKILCKAVAVFSRNAKHDEHNQPLDVSGKALCMLFSASYKSEYLPVILLVTYYGCYLMSAEFRISNDDV